MPKLSTEQLHPATQVQFSRHPSSLPSRNEPDNSVQLMVKKDIFPTDIGGEAITVEQVANISDV